MLAESVAQRMREDAVRARTISIGVRSQLDLSGYGCQMPLERPSAATRDVARAAWSLLTSHQPLDEEHPIRALHVRASNLVPLPPFVQPALWDAPLPAWEDADRAIDELRRRFGNTCIVRGAELVDESIRGLDIKGENTVHPVSYFHV